MIKRNWLFLLLIISVVALLDAIYLVHHHYLINILNPAVKSFCSINSYIDCDTVAKSDYSMMFGIPVASLGVFAYLFVTIFLLLVTFQVKKERQRVFVSFVYPVFLLMIFFSLYQLLASALWVKSFCLMCSFLYLCGALQVVAAKKALGISHGAIFKEFGLFVKDLTRGEGRKLVYVAISFVVSVLVALIVDRGIVNHFEGQRANGAMIGQTSRSEQLIRQYNLLPQVHLSLIDTPMKGEANAPITLVEFSDFQCPACSGMARVLLELVQEYPGKIRLFFKNYPLDNNCNPKVNRPFHQRACIAARYGYCAFRQDRFWSIHDKLFANRKQLTDQFLLGLVKEERLNKDEFNNCLKELAVNKLGMELKEAINIGVNYTPSIFLNGRKISDIVKNRQDIVILIESLLN